MALVEGAEAEEGAEGVAVETVAETPVTRPETRQPLLQMLQGIEALSTPIFPLVTGRGVACTSNLGVVLIFVRNRLRVRGKTSLPQDLLNETGTSSVTKTPTTTSTSIY